jgi:TonB family protein
MSSIPAEPAPWPRRRWVGTLALIFVVQLGLIFGLSEHHPMRPRLPRPAPVFQLVATPPPELVNLTDPTLFALPHRQGFAGLAWLKVPPLEFRAFDFSQPTNWLVLDGSRLGATFSQFTETNLLTTLPSPSLPEEDLRPPYFTGLSNPRTSSTWRVEGELARRRILSTLQLTNWASADLLTNTVVQVVVNRGGRLVSVPLLLASSTSKEADDYALELARSLRFEPSNSSQAGSGLSSDGLTWGQIIFEWNTIPIPPANAGAAP